MLSEEQFAVLREEATERPGSSTLNGEKRKGLFHCAGCDLPAYSSEHKYRIRHRLAELLAVTAGIRSARVTTIRCS